jgi:hypothetical protein
LGLIDGQVQLSGDLLIGQVQAHQIQAYHPGAQGQMPAFKNGARQFIKLGLTGQTLVPLAIAIVIMMPAFEDLLGATVWVLDGLRPAQVADDLVIFCIINLLFEVDPADIVPSRI